MHENIIKIKAIIDQGIKDLDQIVQLTGLQREYVKHYLWCKKQEEPKNETIGKNSSYTPPLHSQISRNIKTIIDAGFYKIEEICDRMGYNPQEVRATCKIDELDFIDEPIEHNYTPKLITLINQNKTLEEITKELSLTEENTIKRKLAYLVGLRYFQLIKKTNWAYEKAFGYIIKNPKENTELYKLIILFGVCETNKRKKHWSLNKIARELKMQPRKVKQILKKARLNHKVLIKQSKNQ